MSQDKQEQGAAGRRLGRNSKKNGPRLTGDTPPIPDSNLPVTARLDYAQLAPSDAEEARASANRIRELGTRQNETIVGIGRELLKIKQKLGHGHFDLWLRAEFDMSADSAQRYMAVAERLGGENRTVRNLKPTTLFKLAAKCTPQALRDEILGRMEKGELISDAEIRSRLGETKRPKQAVAATSVQRAGAEPNMEGLADPLITIQRQWRKLTKRQRHDFLAWAQTDQFWEEEPQPNVESFDHDSEPIECSFAGGSRYTGCRDAGHCLHARRVARQDYPNKTEEPFVEKQTSLFRESRDTRDEVGT